ncbi:hypothetical protein BDB00DRAFT_116022 [Zychaea mexicana]|uniref:uncharacterized protein n=1 Tax=Zychaea mexicana TaxID=64656 RepID=UPI0022FF09F2|nr:uncharacterized protein BDB00DRAFT_116022 [Zychaea mexicana]KAI9484708.1 hypothetical protein BDB00DRAFT_116022 [Zychaea mexicana]
MRSNACLCRNLNSLPFDKDCSPHVLYMDWIGFIGNMLSIRKHGKIYVVQEVGKMYIPRSLCDFADFYDTLKLIYTFKRHLCNLQAHVLPALARKERQEEHEKYDHEVPESEFDTADPEIFYTPKTSRTYAATPAE